MHIALKHCRLDWHEKFLDGPSADRLMARLQDLPWERRNLRLYGKQVREPRDTVWLGDASYRYSGRTNTPHPWPDDLLGLVASVEQATGARYNSCLLNRYQDGKDSIALHADDEPELGPEPTIASLSLGAARRFQIRGTEDRLDLQLTHGSLLCMQAPMQRHYRHGIPKEPKVTGQRINLTFRWILKYSNG